MIIISSRILAREARRRRSISTVVPCRSAQAPKSVKKPTVKTEVKKEAVGLGCVVEEKLNKTLLNIFARKMSRAPASIKDFYNGIKQQKAAPGTSKFEFISEVVNSSGFEGSYFERFEIVEESEAMDVSDSFVSWKAFCTEKGEAVAKAIFTQGKVTTRAHKDLDPEAPSTLELPEEERLEYELIKTVKHKTQTETKSAKRSLGADSAEAASSSNGATIGEDSSSRAVLVAKMRKTHATQCGQMVDINSRIAKFAGNPYTWPFYFVVLASKMALKFC